jgi:N-methylhydantoinase A
VVEAAGLSVERIDIVYELDMHYVGQTHTVAVPLPLTRGAGGTRVTEALVRKAFEAAYSRAFSRLLPGLGIRIVNLRTAAIGRRPAIDLAALAPAAGASVDKARSGRRPVWFGGWCPTDVFSRLDLPVGAVVEGPAVLEQPDATVLVPPGQRARVDRFGNLVLERL